MGASPLTPQLSTPRTASRFVLPAILIAAFLAGAIPFWALYWTRGRAPCDQFDYHLPTILKFARELPRPDLSNYLSATTPGYHLALAAVARWLTDSTLALQIVGSLFTLALLALLGWTIARSTWNRPAGSRASGLQLAALALPIAASPYVLPSGVWLLPDNAGWLLAAIVTLSAARLRQTSATLMFAGLATAALIAVRQSHIWALAPIVMAGWLATTRDADPSLAGALADLRRRSSFTLVAVAACVPGVVVLLGFARLWHGLTPPGFQQQHIVQGSGVNGVAVPFILSLIGAFSCFYLSWLWPTLARLWRESRPLLIVLALLALAWAAIPASTFQREPRAGGLWEIVGILDRRGLSIAGHTSPLILLLAPVGAVMLAAWVAMIDDKRRWLAAATIAAFLAVQSTNANCWERYHDPFLLVAMALIAARFGPAPADSPGGAPRPLAAWRIAGPLTLAAALGAATIWSARTGRDPIHDPPIEWRPGRALGTATLRVALLDAPWVPPRSAWRSLITAHSTRSVEVPKAKAISSDPARSPRRRTVPRNPRHTLWTPGRQSPMLSDVFPAAHSFAQHLRLPCSHPPPTSQPRPARLAGP